MVLSFYIFETREGWHQMYSISLCELVNWLSLKNIIL